MSNLSATTQTILWILLIFIIAINLSLFFAFRNRFRDQPKTGQGGPRRRMPWDSKSTAEAAELHHKLEELRKGEDDPGSSPKE